MIETIEIKVNDSEETEEMQIIHLPTHLLQAKQALTNRQPEPVGRPDAKRYMTSSFIQPPQKEC